MFMFALCACGGGEQKALETAEDYLVALQEAGCPIGEITVFNAETDPNGNLGRPNQYTAKADFTDTTAETAACTIEVFATAEDCESRYEYLQQFADPEMGAFGLNQYMYKSELAILRIGYDVTPDNAKIYEEAFTELTK